MADKDEQQEKTIAEDLVVTKYKMAGDIANRKYLIFWKSRARHHAFQLFLAVLV